MKRSKFYNKSIWKNLFLIGLLLIGIFLSYRCIYNSWYISESFVNNAGSSDPFDLTYAKLYDTVFSYSKLYQTDIDTILRSIEEYYKITADAGAGKEIKPLDILDAGTGSGKHYYYMEEKRKSKYPSWKMRGVDYSDSFLKVAKLRNPDGDFKMGNLTNAETYPAQSFDIILCMYDTIHHNTKEEQEKIFENFYYWLKPNGLIFIHLFNSKELDPAPREYSQYYDKDGKKHAQTNFDQFVHDAYWMKKDGEEDIYQYIEQYILPTGKKKVKIHNFTIPDRGQVISRLKYYGFMPINVYDFKKIYSGNMDLYIFAKKKI
jgi:ubiquinone/menaquinone biosynthesis C-methylase UbiE